MGRLLILAGPEWEGHISRGSVALTSWKQLQVYYEPLGLVKAQRFRLCMRTIEVSYVSQLMEPSPEDIYEGPNMAKCECGLEMRTKFKCDCSTCAEKCLTCSKMRKHILAFEYMPVDPLLASICKSKSMYFKLLNTWRNKEKWLGQDPFLIPENIHEQYDERKFRELQAFWNPEGDWEAPVICPNTHCLHAFKAFATKCDSLLHSWDIETQHYTFVCRECSSRIHAPRQTHQVRIFHGLLLICMPSYNVLYIF